MKTVLAITLGLCLIILGCKSSNLASSKDETSRSYRTGYSEFDLSEVEELGRIMYLHDQLAWRATDIMREESLILSTKNNYGWIVTKSDENWKVRWLKKENDRIFPVCDVVFKSINDWKVEVPDEAELTLNEIGIIKARDAAMKSIAERCAESYNSVAFVHPDGSKIVAYALAATSDPDLLVVGGHYKVETSLDGSEILSSRQFTKSCFSLSKNDPSLPEGAKLAAWGMTHILDDTPVETHVFLSKCTDLPLYVSTEFGFWKIEDGRITQLKDFN